MEFLYLLLSIVLSVIGIVFFIKSWIMTNDVREIKVLIKELLDQRTLPVAQVQTSREKQAKPVRSSEPGWAKDLTEEEITQAQSLIPKLYQGEVIIKDLSTNMVQVWDKESWEKDKDVTKFKLIYGK